MSMSRPRLPAAVAAVAVTLLIVYAVLWVSVGGADVEASDFTATYVGATLLRDGHAASLYDESLQAQVHASLIGRSRANLPFVNPPMAAVLAVPVTLLPLQVAYRLWQLLQLVLLGVAVLVAARAAPWPAQRRRAVVAASCLVALAGPGTLVLGLLGQWDGFSALGLAAAYALWRRDRPAAAGAVLAVTAAVAKPHLAIGLAALLVGWRERRLLLGAAAGVVGVAALSLVASGPGGVAGFVGAAQADATRWPLASMLGFSGLTGSWLGDGAASQLVAAIASLMAVGVCVALGHRLRKGRMALEPALAAATTLSLLASPHLLAHDLVLLAPVMVGLLAWAWRRDGAAAWPGPTVRLVSCGWAVVCLACALDLGSARAAPPGRLVPWALLALAALTIQLSGPRTEPSAGHRGRLRVSPRQAS